MVPEVARASTSPCYWLAGNGLELLYVGLVVAGLLFSCQTWSLVAFCYVALVLIFLVAESSS